MNSESQLTSSPATHADARRLVEETYSRWLGKTNDATAAAVLAQCEIQLQQTSPVAQTEPVAGSGPFSVKEVAAELGVSPETVYKLCAENALRHTRVGRRITITRQQLDDYRNRPQFRHVAA